MFPSTIFIIVLLNVFIIPSELKTNCDPSLPEHLCKHHCPRGQAYDENLKECTPLCTKNCINGQCTSKEYCTCNYGFVKDREDPFTCHPQCTYPCENGRCVGFERCACNLGFYKDTRDRYKCHSLCSKPCENGTCTSLDVCSCNTGYIHDKNDTFKCIPDCGNCKNGICTAPNTCSCLPGYIPDKENPNECVPTCSKECINGYCADVDVCRCKQGYEEELGKCVPVCFPPCVNGTCTAPDVCECPKGLRFNRNMYACDKPCLLGCEHGRCENGECICQDGYNGKACDRKVGVFKRLYLKWMNPIVNRFKKNKSN